MSDSVLDPEELAAIAAAVREAAPAAARRRSGGGGLGGRMATGTAAGGQEHARLALITDDRSADMARPMALDLASRWSKSAPRALRGYLPGTWTLDVLGAEVIEGNSAKAELRGGWIAAVANPRSEIIVVAQGPIIDLAAARRCGAAAPTPDLARTPTALSLKLFEPVGKAIVDSFTACWHDSFDESITATKDVAVIQRLVEARSIIRATLQLSDAVGGRIVIYARPECFLKRPVPLAANKAKPDAVATALSNVTVELVVELGSLRMTLGELSDMQLGEQHTLPQFVDSRVPVFCEGVLKAWAKPVVSRGVLAIQILSIVHGQGTKS